MVAGTYEGVSQMQVLLFLSLSRLNGPGLWSSMMEMGKYSLILHKIGKYSIILVFLHANS